jgi:PhnB protein
MAVKPIPEGYHSVTPYLTVQGAAKLLDFLQQAFDAKVTERMDRPDGRIGHAEVRIGDSVVMLAEASDQWKPMTGGIYLYVEDTDAAFKRALEAGAVSIMEPANQFYGDRNAGIKDPAGNFWWIATHVEDVAPPEMKKRAEAFMKKQAHA